MWGHSYYEIRGDETYSKQLLTSLIIQVLENAGSLKRKGSQEFENADSFPPLTLTAINSDKGNFGRPEQFNSKFCNMIDIITYEINDEVAQARYMDLFTKIAKELNWELIDDHNA